jgi:hypothetical protein
MNKPELQTQDNEPLPAISIGGKRGVDECNALHL